MVASPSPDQVSLDARVQHVLTSRVGEVVRVAGTTAVVQWEPDGDVSRVRKASLKVLRKGKKVDIPATKAAPKRRFDVVVDHMLSRKGWTWNDLVRETGLSRKTIYHFMSLAPEHQGQLVSTLEKIAQALNVSPREFWE